MAEHMDEVQAALATVKGDPRSRELFEADPITFLQSQGIDMDALRKIGEVSDPDLAMLAGGGCYSFGYYVCYYEG